MTLSLGLLYAVGVAYLILLFGIAFAVERSRRLLALARNPWIYTLSLGVYATSWTFYGNLGFLEHYGYLYLTIYLGVTLAFAATPWLLRPLLDLTRTHQLTSLADLFAFRYRSPLTGRLVALFMLTGVLPYIALQIKAVTESAAVLTADTPPQLLALAFTGTIALFTILFGARHITPREKHAGLVVAIAFESVVKLAAILGITIIALFAVFGGFAGLQEWLQANPEATEALYAPVLEGGWWSLMILAFAAAFLLPRQFHMIFSENADPRALDRAAWAFPLFLLVLNLPMPVLYWAGLQAEVPFATNYFALGIAAWLESPTLALIVFIGGVSAASAMMIVTTLALANMGTNYLSSLNRLHDRTTPPTNLYRNLQWGRGFWILLIMALGYAFYGLLQVIEGLAQLGLISFAAVAQFLPGLVGLLAWPRATGMGFLTGLTAGILMWCLTLVLPLLAEAGIWGNAPPLQVWLRAEQLDVWTFALTLSLGLNSLLFVIGSLLSTPSTQEADAAEACCPSGRVISLQVEWPIADTVEEMENALAGALGTHSAQREIMRALSDLNLNRETRSRHDLQRLRAAIESNLSGLLGPVIARVIVDQHLVLAGPKHPDLLTNLRRVELQLEETRPVLTGLSAELDALRRFHRRILHELPLGVCSIGSDGSITGWNQALQTLTGVASDDAIGRVVEVLPSPWGGLLRAFLEGDLPEVYKLNLETNQGYRRLNLHRSNVEANAGDYAGCVLLVEDVTRRVQLEQEVAHNDRLALIGRFAAGVAHEIGNPVAGIASLAQTLPLESPSPEIRELAADIVAQTHRIDAILKSLLAFAHAESPQRSRFEPLAMADLLTEAVRLKRLAGRSDVQFEFDAAADLFVRGARAHLLQVMINILTNAEQASPPGGKIAIRTKGTRSQIRVSILDQGRGLDESRLDRLFEPFFTTKPPGQGTGLGLSVAHSIIQDHGGTLSARNHPGGGAEFILILPRHVTSYEESGEPS